MKISYKMLLPIAISSVFSNGGYAADQAIHNGYSETADQYTMHGNIISNIDVTAKLWNPRGKTNAQIAERASYLVSQFDAPIANTEKSAKARKRYSDAIFINTLLPVALGRAGSKPEHFASGLARNKAAGVTLASVSVISHRGVQTLPIEEAMLSSTKFALDHSISLVKTTDDIRQLKTQGEMGFIFNAQASDFAIDDLSKIAWAEQLGMKVMNFTYNIRNALAGGGQDDVQTGLSSLGIKFVEEMNNSGVVVDVSHSSSLAAIDAAKHSTKPIMASHSNARGLMDIGRNLTDEAITAIGKTNGVVCTTGVGMFLNKDGDASPESFVEHIVYTANLIGRDKTCFSTDYLHYYYEMLIANIANITIYPPEKGWGGVTQNTAIEHIWSIVALLEEKHGWSEQEIRGFLGENVMRVYQANWK